MEPSEVQRALEAGRSTASTLGLRVDHAIVVHNSNRIAVRLTPCDVLARVAPVAHQAGAEFEVEVGRRLADAGSPVEQLEPRVEPRVYVRDGFAVTLWTYYEAVSSRDIAPAEYAQALERHHACMRQIDLTARTSRIESRKRSGWSATAPRHRSLVRQAGSFSATRCEA